MGLSASTETIYQSIERKAASEVFEEKAKRRASEHPNPSGKSYVWVALNKFA